MALKFNPPTELVDEYLKSKNAETKGTSDAFNTLLLTYAKVKQDKHKQSSDALDSFMKLLALDPTLANSAMGKKLANEGGFGPADFKPPAASTDTAKSPEVPQVAATPPELNYSSATAGAQAVLPSGLPSLIDRSVGHFKLGGEKAAPAAKPAAQTGMFPDYGAMTDDQLGGHGTLGKAEFDKRKEKLGMQKTRGEMAPKTPITKEDLLASGKQFDPMSQIIVEPTSRDASDANRELRLSKAVTEYGRQIETHPVIKKLMDQAIGIDQVSELANLVKGGNTVASAAMGIKMAKAMGEVGVMTETDISRYVESRKLTQRAADILGKWISGTPSNATLQEIGQISGVLKDSFGTKIQPIYDRHIDRFARSYHMKPQEAAYLLALPYGGGTTPNPSPEADHAGKRKVSNGTETLWIDPADAAEAAKEGFRQVP